VTKSYSDSSTTAVAGFTLSCTSGTITPSATQSRTGGGTVTWTFTGFSSGASCSVSETTVPSGYSQTSNTCTNANLGLTAGAIKTCTIKNTLNSATFTVHKDFSDGNTASVSVGLTCSNGTVTNSPQNASDNPDSPAVFTVTGIPAAGTTCSASEGAAPTGY